jgi:hypothetical protein
MLMYSSFPGSAAQGSKMPRWSAGRRFASPHKDASRVSTARIKSCADPALRLPWEAREGEINSGGFAAGEGGLLSGDNPNAMRPAHPNWLVVPWTRLDDDREGREADLEYLAELADRRRQIEDPPRAAAQECGRKSCRRARGCRLGPSCIHPAMRSHVVELAKKAAAAAAAERKAARRRSRSRRKAP